MPILKEFKEFALKGNVIDMAVGVIVGGAFGKIVTSLTNDVLMPMISIITGRVPLTSLSLTIPTFNSGEPYISLNYGQFLQNTLDFFIIALSIFMMVKMINKLKKKHEVIQESVPEPPSTEEVLLTEIRDLLKDSNNNY